MLKWCWYKFGPRTDVFVYAIVYCMCICVCFFVCYKPSVTCATATAPACLVVCNLMLVQRFTQMFLSLHGKKQIGPHRHLMFTAYRKRPTESYILWGEILSFSIIYLQLVPLGGKTTCFRNIDIIALHYKVIIKISILTNLFIYLLTILPFISW